MPSTGLYVLVAISEVMVPRFTRGLAMVVVGAVFVAVLLISGLMLASSLYTTATQPTVSGATEILQTPSGPQLNANYSNLGNRPSSLPPLSVPLLVVKGFPFSLAPAALNGSVSSSGDTTTVTLPSPSMPPACVPGLTVSSPSPQGYAGVSGASLSGPAVLSAVFAGSSEWPSGGYGLMIGTNLSSLFVIQPAGIGNTTATVTYDNYSKSAGGIAGVVSQSSPFGFGTDFPTEFTLSLDGFGGFVVSVNGVPRLNGSINQFTPGYSPLAVWTTNVTSLIGLVTFAAGATRWVAPNGVCGSFLVLPLSPLGTPFVLTNITTGQVVGPVPAPGSPTGSLYVLEMVLASSAAASTVSIGNCNPVTLGVDGTIAFTAPWVS